MPSRYWLVLAVLLPMQVFAQPIGKVTFIEGKLRLIRDAALMQAAQGVPVEASDILETSKPGFALVEFTDGTVIALGEASRAMIERAPQGKTAGAVMLLEGWLKLQARLPGSEAGYGVSSPVQSASARTGNLIIHAAPGMGETFVESGTAMLGLTDKRGRATGLAAVKAGSFVTRASDKPAATQARPGEPFLASMPAAFKDALPARLERFKDRSVDAKPVGPVAYADVADWLNAPMGWRAGFVKRFEPRLADASFRQPLDASMKQHPEWDKILHPPRRTD